MAERLPSLSSVMHQILPENLTFWPITFSMFIIYLHNELETCRRSWTLPGCKISEILIGLELSKNWKNQRKMRISSFLLIIYLHRELQTYRRSWNLPGCKISGILITAFGHQGALNYQKIILFIIYLHIELQTCRRSWNLPGCKISGKLIHPFGHQGPRIVKKLKNLWKIKYYFSCS